MNRNARLLDEPLEFELGPAHPQTEYDSEYQVESNRKVIKRRRKAVFDDGVRPGSKDR